VSYPDRLPCPQRKRRALAGQDGSLNLLPAAFSCRGAQLVSQFHPHLHPAARCALAVLGLDNLPRPYVWDNIKRFRVHRHPAVILFLGNVEEERISCGTAYGLNHPKKNPKV